VEVQGIAGVPAGLNDSFPIIFVPLRWSIPGNYDKKFCNFEQVRQKYYDHSGGHNTVCTLRQILFGR
jgi:hypothetical protein